MTNLKFEPVLVGNLVVSALVLLGVSQTEASEVVAAVTSAVPLVAAIFIRLFTRSKASLAEEGKL